MRVTQHELELVRRVAISSALDPYRSTIVRALAETSVPLTVKEVMSAIGKKESRAQRLMDELGELGLVQGGTGKSTGGRPPTGYAITPDFRDLALAIEPMDHILDVSGELLADTSSAPPEAAKPTGDDLWAEV